MGQRRRGAGVARLRTRGKEGGRRRCASSGASVNPDARPAFTSQDSHDIYMAAAVGSAGSGGSRMPHVRRTESASHEPRTRRSKRSRHASCGRRRWITAAGSQHNNMREHLRWAWRGFFDRVRRAARADLRHRRVSARSQPDGSAHDRRRWHAAARISNSCSGPGSRALHICPSTVIPTGTNAAGLPVGVQIIGPAYGDRITIGVARLLEAEGFAFVPPPAYV